MATISTANFLIEEKRSAAIYAAILAAYGTGSETGTASKGGANAQAAIAALSDEAQLIALLPGVMELAEALKMSQYYVQALNKWWFHLDQHVGGINDYLETNLLHVHYYNKAIYPQLLAGNVFPPVTDFGSAARSGGSWTWTDQDEVNTTLYGDGLIEIVTEHAIGGADCEVTIVGTDFDGDTVQATATVPSGTLISVAVAVNETTVRFADVTSVTVTGGTNDDAFRVQTKFDRAPTGIA